VGMICPGKVRARQARDELGNLRQMSWFYRRIIRPALFTQDPETIHDWTIGALHRISRHPLLCDAVATFCRAPELPVNLFGLTFPNPVGLAAGMDKDGAALPAWESMGFGYVELGAVTWLAQPGNPKPRIVRVVEDEAIINRMGFNNAGAEAMATRLAAWRAAGRWPKHPVGINLGKSKATPLPDAADDYARSFAAVWPWVDFVVVNVSSPNTPGLRQLQDRTALDEILSALQGVNESMARAVASTGNGAASPQPEQGSPLRLRPVLIKVAPDLTFEALDELLGVVDPRGVAGIVATNTTIARPTVSDPDRQQRYAESGGLSGRPLRERSTEVVRHLYRQTQGAVPILGVGGIHSAEDAWEKITAGASLVQVYTGLVFAGPGLPQAIVQGLRERLLAGGFNRLDEAVGSGVDS
jgi:dihydroorotate dehydrogenase